MEMFISCQCEYFFLHNEIIVRNVMNSYIMGILWGRSIGYGVGLIETLPRKQLNYMNCTCNE